MKPLTRRLAVFIVLPAAVLFLTACGSESSDATDTGTGSDAGTSNETEASVDSDRSGPGRLPEWTTPEDMDYVPPEPDLGATMNVAYGSDPNTLNPLIANDTTSSEHIHYWTVEALATRSYQDPDTWEPRLARDWEIKDDGMRYVIHLRKGVQFHPVKTPEDEEIKPGELTAYDLRFTYRVGTNPEVEAGHLRNYWQMIEEVNVVDDYTAEIVWGEQYFDAKGVTLSMMIIPERVYGYDAEGNVLSHNYSSSEFAEAFNNHWANSNTVSGTGPYRLESWERGEGFALQRFEDYYAEEYPTPMSYHKRDHSPKRPFFKRIEYDLIEKQDAQYRALLDGDIIRTGLTPNQFEKDLKQESAFQDGRIKHQIYDYPSYRYIGWNMRKPMFDDRLVRRAMTHAVPRKEIIENVFLGYARRTTGPFFFKYPAYNEDVEPLEYDLDRARELLDEAGWDRKTDEGIRYKEIDGERVTFEFDMLHYADSPEFAETASIIEGRLSQIGIVMTPEPIKWNEFLETIRSRKFDACIIGWAMGYVSDPYQLWHSSQAGPGAGSNHVGWENDRSDEIVEEIRRTMDVEKRRKLYHEFHELLHKHQPYTFLWTRKNIAAYYKYLHDVGQTEDSEIQTYSIRPNVDRMNWYIAK